MNITASVPFHFARVPNCFRTLLRSRRIPDFERLTLLNTSNVTDETDASLQRDSPQILSEIFALCWTAPIS